MIVVVLVFVVIALVCLIMSVPVAWVLFFTIKGIANVTSGFFFSNGIEIHGLIAQVVHVSASNTFS